MSDITRKGIDVAIHLHVDECNRKAVREFAEYLADNNYHLMKTISNEIIVVNQKGYKIERKGIDKVIAEWQKREENE